MTPTDEALVADFDSLLLLIDMHLEGVNLQDTIRANRLLHAARVNIRLSQPPSGGWDDAAVERAGREFWRVMSAENISRYGSDGSVSTWDEIVAKDDRNLGAMMKAMRAALNAAAPRESLSVEKEDE